MAEESNNSEGAPGGDGEVEGCALDSMDKLHREIIVFKGTVSCDHLTALIDERER